MTLCGIQEDTESVPEDVVEGVEVDTVLRKGKQVRALR